MRPNHPAQMPDTVREVIRQWAPDQSCDRSLLNILARNLPPSRHSDVPRMTSTVADRARGGLQRSDLWWVSSELCKATEAAYTSVPDEAQVGIDTMRSPSGFAVFEDPIMVLNRYDEDASWMTPIDAIAWFVDFSGPEPIIALYAYAWLSTLDERDDDPDDDGDWFDLWPTDAPIVRATTSWSIGAPLSAPLPSDVRHTARSMSDQIDANLDGTHWLRRLAATVWLLSTQPGLTEQSDASIPRSTQKRSLRADMPSAVKIVKLRGHSRRCESSEGDRGSWSLDHRIIVDGHWRNQACGPGRTKRRPVWINPHIRGPEDAPLVVKNKVFVLD
jgi:hypothetical protein